MSNVILGNSSDRSKPVIIAQIFALYVKLTSNSKEDMFYKRFDHKLMMTHDADEDKNKNL